ncbi:phage baseplate assembly protein V [Dactylosporangium sp. NPDC051541]|uniref:phage baseplate assembly protein V n=1 Tax=Dactylosporangium sp. NPDC051541 TaxID=3363977 RepID=UPI0037B184DA
METGAGALSLDRVVAGLVEKVERRFFGKYRGIVVENEDPYRLGRLKVKVPSVLGRDVVTGWATPCAPYGGAVDRGFLFIPEREAQVWVEFEEGDLEFPIWAGTFWTGSSPDNTPVPRPQAADGQEEQQAQDPPTRKIIKSAKGHTIQFEDKDSAELVTIVEAVNGNVITMDKQGIAITSADGHTITLDGSGITVTDGKNSGNAITMSGGGVVVKTSGTQVAIGSSGVQVGGSGATEPFVLGNKFAANVQAFISALSTHTHIGNLGAPTSPPAPPPMTLQVPLSTKHKVE